MKQVLKVKTDKDISPSESVLLMEIGETECSFGIMHHASRIIYEFAYYRSGAEDDQLIKNIIDKSRDLSRLVDSVAFIPHFNLFFVCERLFAFRFWTLRIKTYRH